MSILQRRPALAIPSNNRLRKDNCHNVTSTQCCVAVLIPDMALITLSGFPAAGKSTRALQIRDFLHDKLSSSDYNGPIQKVLVMSDHSLALPRSVYNGMDISPKCRICSDHTVADSASEKPARGTIFTNLQRQLAADTILILDSLNYIKGFRYQMYCAARELKLRTCTVRSS